MKNYKHIFWDWNGTIIDDVKAACLSVNDMLIKRDMSQITMTQYYKYIDTPISRFYENLFDLNIVTFDIISKEFSKGYKKYLNEKPLMNGIDEVLNNLQIKEKNQVILSSSNILDITSKTKKYNVKKYFTNILAHNNFNAESKILLAKNYIKSNKINTENIIVIGDTLHDYKVAQSLECDCILTTQGHQSMKELSIAKEAIIIKDIKDVLNIVK